MKYLKTYSQQEFYYETLINYTHGIKWAHLPDDIFQEIKDICLELSDKGLHVDYRNERFTPSSNQPGGIYTIIEYPAEVQISNVTGWERIEDYKTYKNLVYDDIKEVVERIEEYMDSVGYNILVSPEDTTSHYYIWFVQKNNQNSV